MFTKIWERAIIEKLKKPSPIVPIRWRETRNAFPIIHGHFPIDPKFRKFRLVHPMERTALVCSDRNLKVHGPLWPVGTKCSFPFDQTVVPRTALLYPAYKKNNQTRGGLGRVRATGVTVPFHWARGISEIEFQTGILFNRKRPFSP